MPFDYVNINGGTREQWGSFVEWERAWSEGWTTALGVRDDLVWMDTGPVQSYSGATPQTAAFNALDRARTDINVDATVLVRNQPDDRQSYEWGVARKTRSPNFYERYAWGTSTTGMVTWFGDGNGYTGNPDLKPETAYNLSFTADWHDGAQKGWQIKVTPYYSDVQNYIGAVQICGPACTGMPVAQLMFENHEARLYGTDLSASATLFDSSDGGQVALNGTAGFVHGQDLTTHTGLYHMMPFNATVALQHQSGAWSSALELRAVDAKTQVDETRLEPTTPGYAILNLRTAYRWQRIRLDVAVNNLLDHQYYNPLGGSWLSGLYGPTYMGPGFGPLPAPGRSVNTSVTVNF
jgi:iron complex outermembrane receptor protein